MTYKLVSWDSVADALVNRLAEYRDHTQKEILQCRFGLSTLEGLRTEGTKAVYYNITDRDWEELSEALQSRHGYALVRLGKWVAIISSARPMNWTVLSFKRSFPKWTAGANADETGED